MCLHLKNRNNVSNSSDLPRVKSLEIGIRTVYQQTLPNQKISALWTSNLSICLWSLKTISQRHKWDLSIVSPITMLNEKQILIFTTAFLLLIFKSLKILMAFPVTFGAQQYESTIAEWKRAAWTFCYNHSGMNFPCKPFLKNTA